MCVEVGDWRQDIKDLVTLGEKKSEIRKTRHAQRIKINGKKKRCVCIDIENERERGGKLGSMVGGG